MADGQVEQNVVEPLKVRAVGILKRTLKFTQVPENKTIGVCIEINWFVVY